MAERGSAKVSIREIDNSAFTPVNRVLTGTPAGVVGRAKRGPAFVPTVFADIQEFQDIFGSFSDKGLDSNSNLFGPLAVNEWMSGNPGQGAFVKILGTGTAPNFTDAGFTVGTKKLGDSGLPAENLYANTSAVLGKTFMLGHFAKNNTDSKYLSESGIPSIKLREVTTITVNDTTGITLNKNLEITASGSTTAHTFTFDSTATATTATVIKYDVDDETVTATQIKNAINLAFPNKIIATSSGAVVTLSQFVDSLADDIDVTTTATGLTIVKNVNDANTKKLYSLLRGVLMTPHSVKATLANSVAVPTGENNATIDVGANIGDISTTNLDFTLYLVGHKADNRVITCSFDPSKSNYFAKVLNTDPHKIEEYGHYLHSYYDIDVKNIALPTNDDGLKKADGLDVTIAQCGAFCVSVDIAGASNFEEFNKRFQTAVSPWVVSQDFGLIADGSNNNNIGNGIVKLFRLHALDDGEIGNNQIKVNVSNLIPGEFGAFGTFDLSVQRLDSNPLKNDILVSWKRLSLDSTSPNYIARVIGDKRVYWDFDASKPGLQEEGSYPVKNRYVRVEVSPVVTNRDIDASTMPSGFAGLKSLKLANRFAAKSGVFLYNYLSGLIQPPVPMIRSIGKIVLDDISRKEAKILPWGVKFAVKENVDIGSTGYKEYIEQTYNRSLQSYSKFFNENIWDAVVNENTGDFDYANDPNFFHFEKIRITHKGGTEKKINNKLWGDAIFLRNSDASSDTPPTADASNRRFFRVSKDLSTVNSRYLSFSFFLQGGFDGLDIFDEDKHLLKDSACWREGQTVVKIGPVISAYQNGIDVYTDKAAAEIQLLIVPGIREKIVTNYGIQSAERRFDTMYLMDIEQLNEEAAVIINGVDKVSVGQSIDNFSGRSLDTSFAACFFPDVMLNKPNGGSIKVPPSVAVLGVMSRADGGGTAPWYAPAGISRGLVNASGPEFAINQEQLDELYNNDINPLYIPSGRNQLYVFGQKTLLKNPSALDRINVRRLLIYVRRQVKAIANTFLFQSNRADTLSAFSKAVEPILANIQAQQGIERYKVQIDTTTTTQTDVENNTIRGKIYLQPTKSIEFISLDFEVRNSID